MASEIFKLALEKAEEHEMLLVLNWDSQKYQKTLSMCFVGYRKAFDFIIHVKLWIVLIKMEIPKHLIVLR